MRRILLASLLTVLPITHSSAQDAGKQIPLFVGPPGEHENLMAADRIQFMKVPLSNGQTRLVIWGGVADGDSSRFRDAIEQTPKPISEILILASPGGLLGEGLQIGRIIHNHKLATRIPGFGKCVSACNFIFLGGLVRTIDVGGQFIVHLFHSDGAPKDILLDIALAAANLPPDAAAGDPAAPSAKSASPPADTVSKIGPPTPPKHLHALGCEMDHVYTEAYDRKVQRQTISMETGKDEDEVDLGKEKVKSPEILAQLRAATMDYLCMEQTTAVSSAEIALFLVEMRMSLRFFTAFTNISNALPVPMTRDELRSYNITNTD
jgi:hypothetical protein